jgi:dihydroorotate dehydrogenase electron transfer subunit
MTPHPAVSSQKHFHHERAPVLENARLARDTWRVRLQSARLAGAIRPGQFLMLRWPDSTDPLLGRPFALYDSVLDGAGQPVAVDVVYLVVGKMTALLATLKAGDQLDMWGPLGNGFPDLTGNRHVALVAGGIGQTPFLAHVRDLLGKRGYGGRPAQRQVETVSLYYGARSADLLAGVEDFRQAGAVVDLSTDDGSAGHRGFVTELLVRHLQSGVDTPQHLIGCGPEPMMRTLSQLAEGWRLPCHLSLETPMACGVGVCFSCVTPVKTADGWDYRRVCVEGPVFDAARLAWDSSR